MINCHDEAACKTFILEGIDVTHQRLTVMKALLMKVEGVSHAPQMVDRALAALKVSMPKMIFLDAAGDVEAQLKAVSECLSWSIAGREAVWDLVHNGVLIPASATNNGVEAVTIPWTTVPLQGGGGMTSSWTIEGVMPPCPHTVFRSRVNAGRETLCDPDLYLEAVAVANCPSEVAEALREAIRCYRAELYTACVVMLGKASEGAWIEMGKAMFNAIPEEHPARKKSLWKKWSGSDMGIAVRIRELVAHIQEQHDAFSDLYKHSGIVPSDLKLAALWADAVRDTRNVIHHGNEPVLQVTYETATSLLLCAPAHLRKMDTLCKAAATKTAGDASASVVGAKE